VGQRVHTGSSKTTRGDSLLDVYIVRPVSILISCDTVEGISDHCGVLLEMYWVEKGLETHEKRLIPIYHMTNLLGLQNGHLVVAA